MWNSFSPVLPNMSKIVVETKIILFLFWKAYSTQPFSRTAAPDKVN